MLFELEPLKGAKLDQVYQYSSSDLLFRFHKSGEGSFELRTVVPFCFFMTKERPTAGDHFPFCAYLRKHVRGMYLQEIEQMGFNRVIRLRFSFKDVVKYVILEFFDKGNIIVSSDGVIIDNCLSQQRFKDRSLRPGLPYTVDDTPMPQTALRELAQDGNHISADLTISKVLATHCRLGGVYAKRICEYLGISPTVPFLTSHIELLSLALDKLFEKQPFIVRNDQLVPILFATDVEKTTVVSVCMSSHLSTVMSVSASQTTVGGKAPKLTKHQKIIVAQEKQLAQIKEDVLSHQDAAKQLQQMAERVEEIVAMYHGGTAHISIVLENKKDKTITVDTDLLYNE
jgi:predicted ribosome quality control (RQC) complex YloA/Tae2 family protein